MKIITVTEPHEDGTLDFRTFITPDGWTPPDDWELFPLSGFLPSMNAELPEELVAAMKKHGALIRDGDELQ